MPFHFGGVSQFAALRPFWLLLCLLPVLAFTQQEGDDTSQTTAQQNVSEFDVIDANVDGLISYLEFQRWHQAALGVEPKKSATLFGMHDLDRDGKLTVAEFVPLAFELSRKPEREAEKVFEKFDANSDGFLSVQELSGNGGGEGTAGRENASRDGHSAVSTEIVAGLFHVADTDDDQRISRDEFARVADTVESHISQEAKNLGQAQSLMAVLDTDGNGRIDGHELSEYASRYGWNKGGGEDRVAAAETTIRELDRNGDGGIDRDELKRVPEVVMHAAGIRPIIPA